MEDIEVAGKEMILSVVKNLVDSPESVTIESVRSTNTVIFSLKVNPADAGKIIGKNGKNISSLRHLIYAYTSKHQQRALLELIED